MKHPSFAAVLIGTGFGTGFSPFAPGTCGALLAMAIWGLFYAFFPSVTHLLWGLSALIVVFTVVGVWAANRLEACWGTDPSRVVVDEMVGTWIPLLAVPDSSSWYLYAFHDKTSYCPYARR